MKIMIMIIPMILISIISMITMKISTIISLKIKHNTEKMSPFECGFNPTNPARLPFSMRFFLITIIFLIFDVEIALLVPMIYTFSVSKMTIWTYTSILFLLILLIGLFHEWNQGALNWL